MTMTPYQEMIHLSRYARWNADAGRRETWSETVTRYVHHFRKHLRVQHNFDTSPYESEVYDAIHDMKVMPSMRCLMMAGPALEREPLAGYNCSFVAVTDLKSFSEIMYVLMCGTGAGFSVERQFVGRLPMLPRVLRVSHEVIHVPDDRIGWCQAYAELLDCLFAGRIPSWDVSAVRGPGTRLVTTGGYASGPAPLVDLFNFTIAMAKQAVGRRWNSLECHDICCKIGDIVVVGGVRRSALISLSNLSDLRMRHAKSGDWRVATPWRQLANNSAAYQEQPTVSSFMAEWLALYESKSGERGIFNRVAATDKCKIIGRRTFWDEDLKDPQDPIDFGTNPCGEIVLRSRQLCNLSEAIVRADDTEQSLLHKVRIATILGTWQSTLTKFQFLCPEWQQNCEEERLLGVSLTGIMDSTLLNRVADETVDRLQRLRISTRTVNRGLAKELHIPPSAAITTVKPSGTVSQLTDTASGIHARFAPYYIRRITMGIHDPICQVLKDQGVPWEPHAGNPDAMIMFLFPIKAPAEGVCEGDRTAINTLEHWKLVQKAWADHNVSVTVTLKEKEWIPVGGWVWENFDDIGGVSFLPYSGSGYAQMPYEAITRQEYDELVAQSPKFIDWFPLSQIEKRDTTAVHHELACTAGGCELV